ncbi:5-hydroxytryptamine receptor 7-like [Neoarius graeffei]|uniref:5-hydroxytryptamine receptor 7-like n=1 Tax=Neoarius graeffei TaxID=443677 RepID=UPI00298C64FE|nr:5-hydroxytryptamine receptor 7-like [Neoarius graeffei]
MVEARAAGLDTGAALLLARLFSVARDTGDTSVAGSGSESWAMMMMTQPPPPSTGPRIPPEAGNRTRCAAHVQSYGGAERALIGGVLTALTLVTACGNLLVVVSVCSVKKLRQPSNYLIVSLALADLSVALAVMPFVSVTDLIGGRWIFGQFFCNVFIAMDVMCCTASIMTLCVISIDRYLGITRPLTYPVRQNGWCMARMVLSVWLLSASITLPPLFGWAQNVNDDNQCLISQDFGYTIYSTAVAFYIPMSVMLVMYRRIYRAAKLSAAKHAISGFPRPSDEGDDDDRNSRDDDSDCMTAAMKMHRLRGAKWNEAERKSASIFKREQKAAATLGLVLGAFTFCWLPFFVLSTLRPFVCGVRCSCVPLWIERTLLWLGYANSLINPFIYAFSNRDLRTAYRSLLACRYRNINRRLSAAGVHEALRLGPRSEVTLSV